MRILYITHDGLTDHIGQSQILPYLLGLSKLGFAISIISAEKSGNSAKCVSLALQLKSTSIGWHYVTYHNKPPLISTVFDLCSMYWLARKVVCVSPVGLVHCRGFLPTFIGMLIKRRFRVPLVFDFRDFWADRRLISSPYKFVYRFLKRREGWMIRSADHIVTLTEKAKGILQRDYLSGSVLNKSDQITVIPTCADFSHFDTRGISVANRRATRQSLGIGTGETVVGYLGTLHPDYMPEAIFRAFLVLRSLRPGAKFVFISLTAVAEIMRYATIYGLDERDVLVIAAVRADVPRYLSIFDLSIVFVRPDRSTAGVSPTKLNELFACNIPVLANAGVGDLDLIVKPEVNDSVLLYDFSEVTLMKAIRELLQIVDSPLRRGRDGSIQFSLDKGIDSYHTVYSRFVQPEKAFARQ
jgi:glycosyltransferase involved in cell wall biosynthesis